MALLTASISSSRVSYFDGSIDRQHLHPRHPGLDRIAALAHHRLRAGERDRNNRRLRLLRQKERPLLEGRKSPVQRASALRIDNRCAAPSEARRPQPRHSPSPHPGDALAPPAQTCAMRIARPRIGILINSFFSSTEHRPGSRGSTTGGSRFETWLHMKIQLRPAGTFSNPITSILMPAARTPAFVIHMATR